MTFVLYLNLWGTTQKLREDHGDSERPLLRRSDLIACQQRFYCNLNHMAVVHPALRFAAASDRAFAAANDPYPLLLVAATLFQRQLHGGERFAFWPLRGALAMQAEPIFSDTANGNGPWAENFSATPFFGPAAVEAANLEKSAQKGSRLFLSTETARTLHESGHALPLRPSEARGLRHFEINWMRLPVVGEAFLDQACEGVTIRARLLQCADLLSQMGGNYFQQMSASIDDLIEWA